MGADHKIDLPVFQPLAGLRGFLGADEAREAADLQREARETLGEVLVVLAREQRGGGDDCDLLSGHCRNKGGAQRDLGLAEADIAADEAVHRPAAFEVAQHIGDGAFLILGLGPGEAVDELVEAGMGRSPAPAPAARRGRRRPASARRRWR